MRDHWSVRLVLPLYRWIIGPLFQLLGPWRVFGWRKVPKEGGLLLMLNHRSYFDPPFTQLACRRRIHFIARAQLGEIGWLDKFMRWYGVIPIQQSSPDRSALRQAIAILREGGCVCIYPEGGVNEKPGIADLFSGAALIARKADCQVICGGLRNTERVIPSKGGIPRPAFRWVTCRWGEAKEAGSFAGGKELMVWAHAELTRLIQP